MFGIGWGEVLVVAVVALLVLGPDKLPEAARTLGRVYGQLYRMAQEAKESIRAETDLAALAKTEPFPPKGSASEPTELETEPVSRDSSDPPQ
ncbi:MAG: Sec-independent protein translocase protein TatB [Candidatus Adiutrix sp.]|jgi:sec-independent protein translocase protein TatB|nr:Sec-independent protein translocase protein TatB [Candidatus Adiutrix sp.]